jgi:hypothetical protein
MPSPQRELWVKWQTGSKLRQQRKKSGNRLKHRATQRNPPLNSSALPGLVVLLSHFSHSSRCGLSIGSPLPRLQRVLDFRCSQTGKAQEVAENIRKFRTPARILGRFARPRGLDLWAQKRRVTSGHASRSVDRGDRCPRLPATSRPPICAQRQHRFPPGEPICPPIRFATTAIGMN